MVRFGLSLYLLVSMITMIMLSSCEFARYEEPPRYRRPRSDVAQPVEPPTVGTMSQAPEVSDLQGTVSNSEIVELIPSGVSNYNANSEPEGFREIRWGTEISDVFDTSYVFTDPSYGGIKFYTKAGDEMSIGAAKLKDIFYGFWKEKLMVIDVHIEGYTNWSGLQQAVFAKFGKGFQSNEYIEHYSWFGNTTTMSLNYSEITKKGTFRMTSAQFSWRADQEFKQKAQEGAETDF